LDEVADFVFTSSSAAIHEDRGARYREPFVPEPHGDYSFVDQGIQRFTYVLLPHTGDWPDGWAVRRVAELNQPAVAMIETYHARGAAAAVGVAPGGRSR